MAKHSKSDSPQQKLYLAVPPELRRLQQWVGSWNGTPMNAHKPHKRASTASPSTWSSLSHVLENFTNFDIAFIFTADDPYVGVDLDACRDPETGEIADWAQKIVDLLDTYTEISRSGTGLHLILSIEEHE